MRLEFVYNDGGRSKYFKATNVGDCVTRAICNATGKDYKEVYDRLKELSKKESVKRHRGHKQSSVRDGVFKETFKKYLKEIGWVRVQTIKKDSKERMHFTYDEIPNGVIILELTKHLTCVKDKVIYDTYDCSKTQYYDEFGDLVINDERLVYGYWRAPNEEELLEKETFESMKRLQEESLAKTKERIEEIKKSYKSSLDKLNKKIKELQHKLKIETNRMNKEIKKVKEEESKILIDKLL